MSEAKDIPQLSEEEKRRILRERRQNKMAKGKATDRLNDILNQGTSVKASSVTSVLDKPEPKTATTTIDSTPTSNKITPNTSSHDDDPEIQDISDVALPYKPMAEQNPDFDDMFQKLLQQQGQHHQQNHQQGTSGHNPMDDLFKMFGDLGGNESNENFDFSNQPQFQNPNELKYQKDLSNYYIYQQKLWNFRFLIIRILATLINFIYHYINIPSFISSKHSYVRDLKIVYPINGFITWFFTIEIAIIASYYIIFEKLGLFHASNKKSFILQGINMLSMFIPNLNSYKPLITRLLGYKALLGIFLGDLSLVIVLFGLLSYKN
ncbi:GET2 [Candida pseudojiufengensis]|uniref:GET2 n=1 Tax=Candida pseudojiufengensis TaxID=497109 RepID=UPI00222516FA|nr:GET2 [Candida pseudojiufengensis]KAI5963741.1 GET2 [Candida pseudojiufengensis]